MSTPKENNFLYDWPLAADSVVIDVGCFFGEFTDEMHDRYKCSVFAFEPLKRFYKECQKKFGENPKICVSNFAVGADDRKAVFHIKGNMTGEYADGEETQDVAYISIRQVLEWAKPCSLLALNCEGGEFEILEWLIEHGWMKKVPNLLVQFHPVVPDCEARYAKIQDGLKETHGAIYHDGWVWQIWRRK